MFFRDVGGDTYPVSAIARIVRPFRQSGQDEHHYFDKLRVFLNDGSEIIVSRGVIDRLDGFPMTSFAAAPGTYAISYFEDEIQREPIIGWIVNKQDEVVPVLPYGTFDTDHDRVVVQMPDGNIFSYNGSWPSVDAYRAYAIEQG